jgi:hypothetical protein
VQKQLDHYRTAKEAMLGIALVENKLALLPPASHPDRVFVYDDRFPVRVRVDVLCGMCCACACSCFSRVRVVCGELVPFRFQILLTEVACGVVLQTETLIKLGSADLTMIRQLLQAILQAIDGKRAEVKEMASLSRRGAVKRP